jgi:hypothetical protein
MMAMSNEAEFISSSDLSAGILSQLLPFLAEGWEEKCLELGVIERKREIKTPKELMMLCFFHLINGCSLMEISEIGRLLNIGKFSDVAFMVKFEKCGGWFAWIGEQFSHTIVAAWQKPKFLENYRALAFDGSSVVEKGRSGRRFRLHYGIDIFAMCTASYKITTEKIGETLCNFPLQKGDLAIGDRAYGTVNGIVHCVKNNADFLLRLRTTFGKVYDDNGKEIDIPDRFQHLKSEECDGFSAFVRTTEGEMLPVRICARKKSDADYEKTLKKLKAMEKKRNGKTRKQTKEFNKYIVVITSLPDDITASDVLEAYRYRWQIEIYFKRLKSILDFGELPKKREESSLTWITGKLMVALLIESFLSSIAFSQNEQKTHRSIWRETKFIKFTLTTGFISLKHFFSEFANISLNFQVEKRRNSARMQLFPS